MAIVISCLQLLSSWMASYGDIIFSRGCKRNVCKSKSSWSRPYNEGKQLFVILTFVLHFSACCSVLNINFYWFKPKFHNFKNIYEQFEMIWNQDRLIVCNWSIDRALNVVYISCKYNKYVIKIYKKWEQCFCLGL